MKTSFTPAQKRMVFSCLGVYTTLYVCRLNLSAALEGIRLGLSLTIPQAGALQTVFALIYACGQFVNGALVDRLNPVRHMLTGLCGAAACNVLAGLAPSYPLLLIAIAGNAVFQSMVWTPIMRLIAQHIEPGKKRVVANFFVALTLVFGHFGAWAISGFLSALVGWRFSFIVPACIAVIVFALAGRSLITMKMHHVPEEAREPSSAHSGENTLRMLLCSGFFPVLFACMLYGFIRDCVITWTPTLMAHQAQGAALSSAAFTLILPVINLAGVTLGFVLRLRGAPARSVVVIMMAAAIACCLPLLTGMNMLLTAILLGCICAAMYGANTMFTGLIPMEYDRVGRTGLTAGMVDSFIYLGGAISGFFGGTLYDSFGSGALFMSWIITAVVCSVMTLISGVMSKRYWAE